MNTAPATSAAESTREFVASLPDELAEAVRASAVPHWFNAEILAAILDVPVERAQRLLKVLALMPLVQPWGEGQLAVHELARHVLLADMWQEQREHYRMWSARAASHFASQTNISSNVRIEIIYHLLIADPERGADELRQWGDNWYSSTDYQLIFALVQNGKEHDQAECLTDVARAWNCWLYGRYLAIYNEYTEAIRSFEAALSTMPTDRRLYADCTRAIGDVHLGLGEYSKASEYYEMARSIYIAIRDALGEADCVLNLGNVHLNLLEYTKASQLFEAARAIYVKRDHPAGQANYLQSRGNLHLRLAEYVLARECFDDAYHIYIGIGDRLGEANCTKGLGDTALWLADYPQAYQLYEKARHIYVDIGILRGKANCLQGLGDVHRRLRRYLDARKCYVKAHEIYTRIGNRRGDANCIEKLGELRFDMAEYSLARLHYEEARRLYANIEGARLGEAKCAKRLGDVLVRLAEYSLARECYEEALVQYTEIQDRVGEATCLSGLGDVHVRLAEYSLALACYEAAHAIQTEIGDRLGDANSTYCLGDVHLRRSQYALARQRYLEANSIYAKIGDQLGAANCIKGLGDVHVGLAEYPFARQQYEEARQIFISINARLSEASCLQRLGDVHVRQAELPSARQYFEGSRVLYKSVGSPLGEANCIQGLGDVYLEESDEVSAEATYKDAYERYIVLGLHNEAAIVLASQAQISSHRKDFSTSLRLYMQAIEMAPDNAVLYCERALVHLKLADTVNALEDLATAERLQPDLPFLPRYQGYLLLAQEDYEGAAMCFRAIVEAIPNLNVGFFGLAQALFGLHQSEDALANLGRGLEVSYLKRQVRNAFEELLEMQQSHRNLPGTGEGVERLRAWLALGHFQRSSQVIAN